MNIQKLQKLGIKITKHKLEVLNLFNTHKHLDANQIFSILKNQNVNISLATIYRILSLFEIHNIIIRHNFRDEQSTYELFIPNQHHDHLICYNCDKVIEFFNTEIENIQEKIADENKFTITHHTLTLYGICFECEGKK
ncbi:MAG: Fur family transcriptional regulator [Burkholderiales bacterium]|nr:Fur family transcriptional regulator [Burkholderiales bacterium]